MKGIDLPLALLVTLLMSTLGAFLAGMTPYPLGWLILVALIGMRLTQLRSKIR